MGNAGQGSDQLRKAVEKYEEQLKRAVEAQVEEGRTIRDGKMELGKGSPKPSEDDVEDDRGTP